MRVLGKIIVVVSLLLLSLPVIAIFIFGYDIARMESTVGLGLVIAHYVTLLGPILFFGLILVVLFLLAGVMVYVNSKVHEEADRFDGRV